MKPGTIDWQSLDMVPLFGSDPVLVAHIQNGVRLVEPGVFYSGDFRHPTEGFVFQHAYAWANMPEFPDDAV